jgi:hypothetical protein
MGGSTFEEMAPKVFKCIKQNKLKINLGDKIEFTTDSSNYKQSNDSYPSQGISSLITSSSDNILFLEFNNSKYVVGEFRSESAYGFGSAYN